MKLVSTAIALCLLTSTQGRISEDTIDEKKNPVTKVVALLKDMYTEMEREAVEDEEAVEKMMCWCQSTEAEKSTAIANAESRLSELETTIDTSTQQVGRLTAEIAEDQANLEKAQSSLATMEALRKKQMAEFNSEEKDLLGSISSLKAAVITLDKHHKGASLMGKSSLTGVEEMLRHQMAKHKMMLLGVISPTQKKIVAAGFLQQDYKPAKPPAASGEIYGVLKQMSETFETNLEELQTKEKADAKSFLETKGSKTAEIAAIQGSLDRKRPELAAAATTRAEAKESKLDTQKSLKADKQFLSDAKARCATFTQDSEVRKSTRAEELTSISKATAILTSDMMTNKNLGGAHSFLQRSSTRGVSSARDKAAQLLTLAAKKTGNPALSQLAVAAQMDSFTAVREAIDHMVTQLKEEQEVEVSSKDWCIADKHHNTLQTEKEVRKKSDNEMKIQALDSEIEQANGVIQTTKAEIAESNKKIKQASENRENSNKEFQQTVSDQRETMKLLKKAITVLEGVYAAPGGGSGGRRGGLSLIAKPAPSGFKEYSKNRGGNAAVLLLQHIFENSKALEHETLKDEQDLQAYYEKMVQDTNDAIKTKNELIAEQTQIKATAQIKKSDTVVPDLNDNKLVLITLGKQKAALAEECDYLLLNFDARQVARRQEIDALQEANIMLGGASKVAAAGGEGGEGPSDAPHGGLDLIAKKAKIAQHTKQ